ncbi:serine/threonine protein kinase [Nonomuraea mangrovi]|uniref:Serine/threonine protein kinase n=1 Tax=Nonomuraea mangrovi TaxID=2316207 RepID=A0ABW4SRD5_9ACTN
MSPYDQLRSGDPARLGDYTLLGRLGEGGQGVVYLAADRTGARVAIKWLRPGDTVSAERFLREVRVAQQVAPFCTAQVLATGAEHDRPYIVSEYIEGPSLQRVVQEQGPRTGPALHRLAIGTATALAAIHQAGIVHRDFKPANVIIAPDGPRVIDFGIARALNATSTISSSPVGTPSFMAPEQLLGHQVGPAADLFTWASTIAYAASGRAPFGSDTMPAVINRVLNAAPDVSGLDEPLRGVVHACLSKDPAQRPTAEQVIMRLLQHPVTPGGMLQEAAAAASVAGAPHTYPSPGSPQPQPHPQVSNPGFPPLGPTGPPPPQGQWAPQGPPQGPQRGWQPATYPVGAYPPPKKSRTGLVVGLAAGVVALLVIVAVIAVPWERLAGRPTPSPSSAAQESTPKPSATPSRTAVPTQALTKQRLLGTQATAYEHSGDPIKLTSYEVYNKNSKEWVNYARGALTGPFSRYGGNWETLLSPDGRYLAGRSKNYTSDRYDSVEITDQRTDRKTSIKTVKEPLISSIRAWSGDGSKILLNVEQSKGDDWLYLGFAIVDVATKKAEVVKVTGKSSFGWDGRSEGVVNLFGSDLRFFDASGNKVRDAVNVGELPAGTQDIFSPSGRTFATRCPDGAAGELCLWDSASGDRLRKVSSSCDKLLGWYDETHLYCWELDNATRDRVEVVDLAGKEVRTLLDIPNGVGFSPTFTRTS